MHIGIIIGGHNIVMQHVSVMKGIREISINIGMNAQVYMHGPSILMHISIIITHDSMKIIQGSAYIVIICSWPQQIKHHPIGVQKKQTKRQKIPQNNNGTTHTRKQTITIINTTESSTNAPRNQYMTVKGDDIITVAIHNTHGTQHVNIPQILTIIGTITSQIT